MMFVHWHFDQIFTYNLFSIVCSIASVGDFPHLGAGASFYLG
jgi:hypothetical protein